MAVYLQRIFVNNLISSTEMKKQQKKITNFIKFINWLACTVYMFCMFSKVHSTIQRYTIQRYIVYIYANRNSPVFVYKFSHNNFQIEWNIIEYLLVLVSHFIIFFSLAFSMHWKLFCYIFRASNLTMLNISVGDALPQNG